MPPPSRTPHHPLRIYARNLEIHLVKAGITHVELAKRLGLSANAMNRLRFSRNAYIDPDVLFAFTRVFNCTPNELLLPQEGVDYGA